MPALICAHAIDPSTPQNDLLIQECSTLFTFNAETYVQCAF